MARKGAKAAERRKLVGYARVSELGGRNDERFVSLAVQQETAERFAEIRFPGRHDWLGWHTDVDRTGESIDRPALNEAREVALANGASIVVFDFGRFTRSVRDGFNTLEELGAGGVEVLSANEDIDPTTPEGELTLTFFLGLHQYQVRRIGKNWRTVIGRNRDAGWWHGIPPIGYRRLRKNEKSPHDRRSGVIVVDKATAPRVKEIFYRYLNGDSMYSIGMHAEKAGWTKRGPEWVKDVLTNPAYAGLVCVDASYEVAVYKLGARAGQLRYDKHGRKMMRRLPHTPETPQTWMSGQHEPLVTTREFVTVRQRLAREAKPKRPIHTAARWSADRLVRCGSCGRSLQFHDKTQPGATRRYEYLYCHNRQCPDRARISVEETEFKLGALIERLDRELQIDVAKRAKELRQAQSRRSKVAGDEFRAAQAEVKKLDLAVSKVTADQYVAEVDEDRDKVRRLAATLKELQGRLRAAQDRLATISPPPAKQDVEASATLVRSLAEAWAALGFDDRREALMAIGLVLVVDAPGADGKRRVHPRLPFALPGSVAV